MPLTDNSIRFALGIKDPNITFTEDCAFETIKGQVYLIYNGLLSYRPLHCLNCGQPKRLVTNSLIQKKHLDRLKSRCFQN